MDVNINDFLSFIGSNKDEKKSNERQSWYRSPLRPSESVPSFVVYNNKNVWHDYGEGKGGNIIELIMLLYNITNKEAYKALKSLNIPIYGNYSFGIRNTKEESIEVHEKINISDKLLIDYIKLRCIKLDIAEKYCKEWHISFPFGKNPKQIHKVLTFENDLGGVEIRNKYLKIAKSPKSITTIKGNQSEKYEGKINVFEGFFDFMSAITLWGEPKKDSIILNTLSYFPIVNKYNHVSVFIDHGEAAEKKMKTLTVPYTDKRSLFNNFDDINDYLIWIKKNGKI